MQDQASLPSLSPDIWAHIATFIPKCEMVHNFNQLWESGILKQQLKVDFNPTLSKT